MRYLFLASLAVFDFVIAALIVPFHVASKVYEKLEFSTTQCKVITLLTRALYCSTTLHLIAVSYDKYLAIVKSPLTYSQRITKVDGFRLDSPICHSSWSVVYHLGRHFPVQRQAVSL